MSQHGSDQHGSGDHHLLTDAVVYKVGAVLLVLTAVTVAVAHVDLGALNFLVAVLVASVKASLVSLFFMNLYYDKKENGVIFATSFVFLAIFFILTSFDLFFRPEGIYTNGKTAAGVEAKSKIKNPWAATPELVARGKEVFAVNCTACHGVEGKGDGLAAASLNPRPRNFTSPDGWKNGRKPTMVFKTLKEGLPGGAMASFSTLSPDDRWALAHFVLSLGPAPGKDGAEDFAKIGVDPNKADGGEKEEKTVPVEFAIDQLAK